MKKKEMGKAGNVGPKRAGSRMGRTFGRAVMAGLLLGVWAGPLSGAVPVMERRAVVFQYPHSDPYDRGNVYGFNHAPSVAALPDGRLLAAWFSGPYEGSVHQVILGAFSSDGGETWSVAEELQNTPRTSDFDPAFIVDQGRTFFFSSAGRWHRYPFVGLRETERELVGIDSFRVFGRFSDDAGVTWSEPKQLVEETGFGCRSNGVVLSKGELVLPIHTFAAPHTAGVLVSADGGETWHRSTTVETPGSIGAAEPAVAQLSDGRLLMMLRTRDGTIWQAHSEDRGRTWGAAERTEIPAASSSHSLFSTRSGLLVLTHNTSPPPFRTPMTMRVSRDDGITWTEPLILAEVVLPVSGDPIWSKQVSYPSVTQREDGALVVVWTRIAMSGTLQTGVIESAVVRLAGE
jgi:predicted neuraminidase